MAKNYTANSTLEEMLKHPKASEILEKYNVPCMGCAFARFEMSELKLGNICEMYGLDLDGILKALNGEKKKSAPAKKKK